MTTANALKVRERPLLFSGPMIRALLDGTKSQTRRVVNVSAKAVLNAAGIKKGLTINPDKARIDYPVKGMPRLHIPFRHPGDPPMEWGDCACITLHSPYGAIGDRLWVKETYGFCIEGKDEHHIRYPANNECRAEFVGHGEWIEKQTKKHGNRLRPSIFMPRWASRITLEITDVRVERLQSISEDDAQAEGVLAGDALEPYHEDRIPPAMGYIPAYRKLWNSINLAPSPLYETCDNGKKVITSYYSYPWSNSDFDAEYPGIREKGTYRGKPINVIENPWVWCLSFCKL